MHWIKAESQMDPDEYWCWGCSFVSNSFQKLTRFYLLIGIRIWRNLWRVVLKLGLYWILILQI